MTIVGSVAELWRFPVKSMKGEQLQEVTVTEQGVLGDRAYALIDGETGKVVSAKSVKLFPDILACQAAFVAPPRAEGEIPPVRIDLPNGTSVISDSSDFDRARNWILSLREQASSLPGGSNAKWSGAERSGGLR